MPLLAPLVAAVRVANGGMTAWPTQKAQTQIPHTLMRPIAIWVMPAAPHLTRKKTILERAAERVVQLELERRITMEPIWHSLASHISAPSQELMLPTRAEEVVAPMECLRRHLAAERIPMVAAATQSTAVVDRANQAALAWSLSGIRCQSTDCSFSLSKEMKEMKNIAVLCLAAGIGSVATAKELPPLPAFTPMPHLEVVETYEGNGISLIDISVRDRTGKVCSSVNAAVELALKGRSEGGAFLDSATNIVQVSKGRARVRMVKK